MYLLVILICIPVVTPDAKHYFVCLFGIHISFLVKCLFKSFVLFFTTILVIVLIDFYLFWLVVHYEICLWQLFSLSLGLLIFLTIFFKSLCFLFCNLYFIIASFFSFMVHDLSFLS